MIIEKESDLWCTPPELVKQLADACGGFFMDACCNKDNCVVEEQKWSLMAKPDNGLEYNYLGTDPRDWYNYMLKINPNLPENIFMNPPYSNPQLFMEKAWKDSKYFRVISLVKTDMSTDWFNYAIEENEDAYRPLHHNQFSNGSKYIEPVSSGISFLLKQMEFKKTSIGIYHLRKRVKFYYNGKRAKSSGTFPSCIVIYDRRQKS